MSENHRDVFPTVTPVFIRIVQKNADGQIDVMIGDETKMLQSITFEKYAKGKTEVISLDPKTKRVQSSEIYAGNLVNSMIQFLGAQQFGTPMRDTSIIVGMISIPVSLFNIPFIQQTNRYYFQLERDDGSFMKFFEQVDSIKEIHIMSFPRIMKSIFISSMAFKRLKHIYLHTNINMSAQNFLASQAHHISFSVDKINFSTHINLKLKKWLGDVLVDFRSFIIKDCSIDWDTALNDIPIVYQVEIKSTTEYVVQRSDGTVGRLWCKQNVLWFVNEGKINMIRAKNTEELGTDAILQKIIFYEIDKYFELQRQQACFNNPTWPVYVKVTDYGVEVRYNGFKVEKILLRRDHEDNCSIYLTSKRIYEKIVLKNVDNKADLAGMLKWYLFERLKYLTGEKPHHTTVCFGGSWPKELFNLKYFQTANRYEIMFPRDSCNQFMQFLENVDVKKEIVIIGDSSTTRLLDQQFFENCKRLKHLEIKNLCQMGHAQFLKSDAEVLQIVVDSILEAAINRKIKKWLNEEQNFKFFEIYARTDDTGTVIDDVLNGVEYIEQSRQRYFAEPCRGFTIKRNDGKKANLFVSKRRIVFEVCGLQGVQNSGRRRHPYELRFNYN